MWKMENAAVDRDNVNSDFSEIDLLISFLIYVEMKRRNLWNFVVVPFPPGNTEVRDPS